MEVAKIQVSGTSASCTVTKVALQGGTTVYTPAQYADNWEAVTA